MLETRTLPDGARSAFMLEKNPLPIGTTRKDRTVSHAMTLRRKKYRNVIASDDRTTIFVTAVPPTTQASTTTTAPTARSPTSPRGATASALMPTRKYPKATVSITTSGTRGLNLRINCFSFGQNEELNKC